MKVYTVCRKSSLNDDHNFKQLLNEDYLKVYICLRQTQKKLLATPPQSYNGYTDTHTHKTVTQSHFGLTFTTSRSIPWSRDPQFAPVFGPFLTEKKWPKKRHPRDRLDSLNGHMVRITIARFT